MVDRPAYPNLAADLRAGRSRAGHQLRQRRRVGGRLAGGAAAMAASQSRQPDRRPHPDWRGGGRSEKPPQDQQAPGSHAESVAAATLEYRWKCDARRRSVEQRLKEMEESPEWQAQLRTAEEEEQQLLENTGYPPTPRYAPESCIPPPEVAEDWAPSPTRWLPEIPPTPRYEGSPQWTPARPPTPRWPTSAQAVALSARSVRGVGTPEIVADGVGAGGPAVARDRLPRVARGDRGGTGGERGPHPGRQAQLSPTIKAINQLVGAPVEREVTLECIVEVYPKPLNGWYRNEDNIKIHNGNKYNISEEMINLYTWHLNLTIRHLDKSDFGTYSCSSVNGQGKSESRIRLQELRLPPKPPTTPLPYVQTTGKPRRKQPPGHNRGLNEVVRAKETHFLNQMQQENGIYSGGIDVLQSANSGNSGGAFERGNVNDGMINGAEVHTDLPSRNGYEKTYRPPGPIPSPHTPRIIRNAGSRLHAFTTKATVVLVIFLWKLSLDSKTNF
ncbi:uncharacterized protein LOC119559705 [Drosophila subpulchrella]|uniref:uncharacterized protein LOC119559705 n=1 Tax=Drosophila subpulchrella TaxID=1486046 RepID=UPI0018A17DAA|nr:uncharacterized protein LOC119559705 [Drosophila subpulchrella]